jgi:hypothetical protein
MGTPARDRGLNEGILSRRMETPWLTDAWPEAHAAGRLDVLSAWVIRSDATMRSHQRVRGETQRQRVSAVGEFFIDI